MRHFLSFSYVTMHEDSNWTNEVIWKYISEKIVMYWVLVAYHNLMQIISLIECLYLYLHFLFHTFLPFFLATFFFGLGFSFFLAAISFFLLIASSNETLKVAA